MGSAANYNYSQTVIGDCGHLMDGWPLVCGIGGSDPRGVCTTCTEEKYGVPPGYSLSNVWVRIAPEKKKRGGKKPVPVKTKEPAFWEQFLT